ncbi:hypothetical protein [Paenibacillus sp. sgz302251]
MQLTEVRAQAGTEHNVVPDRRLAAARRRPSTAAAPNVIPPSLVLSLSSQ